VGIYFSDDIIDGKRVDDGKVKKASWWTRDATAKDGVTRPHRIRFVVQGYAAKVDAEMEHVIQDLNKQARALRGIHSGQKAL
jgi:hypothetical protein